MERFSKMLLCLLVIVTLVLPGCSAKEGNTVIPADSNYWEQVITIDENGVARWNPIEGAVSYQVNVVFDYEGCPCSAATESTEDTFYQVPQGFCIHVSPVFEDGTQGDAMVSEYFGEYDPSNDPYSEDEPDLYEEYYGWLDGLETWDVVETLDRDSFRDGGDGYVYFEGKGPSGETVRFCGVDTELTDEGVLFHENGWIVALDGVGRIYSTDFIIKEGEPEDWISVFGGYTFDGSMHPTGLDEMIFMDGASDPIHFFIHDDYDPINNEVIFEPCFLGCGVQAPHYRKGDYTFTSDVLVTGIRVLYTPATECTGFRKLMLFEDDYGAYIEGEKYDPGKEAFDPYNKINTFALVAIPDLAKDKNEESYDKIKQYPFSYGISLYPGMYKIGDLKDAAGKVLDKEKDPVTVGSTLTVEMGGKEYDVDLVVTPSYVGARTMHDLVPYGFPSGIGKRNALVIPIAWPDQPESATREIYDEFKSELGRVAELGKEDSTKDYSDKTPDKRYSLSKYMDVVSYGKFELDSYMTEWYTAPLDFSEAHNMLFDEEFIDEMTDWLYATYPDVDWTQFDLDKNGYVDTVILLNAGERPDPNAYTIPTFEGAVEYRHTYGNEYAGTPERPTLINTILTVNADLFDDNTLIHEFSHTFGLIDYYDVSYHGIDAVGEFDMQSGSNGDWNPYSKYSVGWIEPTVVRDLKSGESVDIEIGAFADTGDAIVIPAAGETLEPPFCEYMMVDLFTDTGVNPMSSTKRFNLGGACGVRMYHVDAVMERRDYVNKDFPDMTPCPIGTVHYGNNYKASGKYNLELIQAGGKNTFTDIKNPRTTLTKGDLFYAGSEFTLEKYSAFFDEGLFDYGQDFGYSIKVVSITGSGSDAKAVIRITRL